VPRQATVRLTYGRTWHDGAGIALTGGAALGAGLVLARRWRRRGQPRPLPEHVPPIPLDDCAAMPAPTRRWGAAVPAAVLLACLGARLWSLRAPAPDVMPLYESASRAYGAGQFADAAEYARHALARGAAAPLRGELLALRGESLLRAGQPAAAAGAFDSVLVEAEPNPYVAQALFGLMRARTAAGDAAAAQAARDRLLSEFAESPWAQRARQEPGAAPDGRS
jgi:hypothetical protein